jgi:cyclin-dependent kinase 7
MIFFEMVHRAPFIQGQSDMDQLKQTFSMMGTPTESEWPVSVYVGNRLPLIP